MAQVVELVTYPIKGCAGASLPDALLLSAGLAHDRSLMIVDGDGVFCTQRREPHMARIRPEITGDGEHMVLRAPGVDTLRIDIDIAGPRREVRLFDQLYEGIDQGDEVATWLADLFGAPRRLVRVPPDHGRQSSGVHPGTSGFADSNAVLMVSVASLDGLNSRTPGVALPMNRFRPNIVVDGWEQSHQEDLARRIVIGDAELGYAKLCIRCVVTTIDQSAGVKAGPEPLRTLASYRRSAKGGVAFGAKFSVLRTGKLTVGDELDVTEWDESELR